MEMEEEVKLSVADILQLPSMNGSVVVYGKEYLQNLVSGSNVLELRGMGDLASEGEAVFCSGLLNSSQNKTLLDELQNLQAKKVSAVCYKKSRFCKFDMSEKATKKLLKNIVLIELPVEAVISNIVRELTEEALKRKTLEFRNLQNKTELLLDVLQSNQDIESNLEKIEEIIGNPLIICTANYELIITQTSIKLLDDEMKASVMLNMKQLQDSHLHEAEMSCAGRRCVALTVSLTKNEALSLFIIEEKKRITPTDLRALNRISRLLAVEIKNSREVYSIQLQYRDEFVREMLLQPNANVMDMRMLGISYGLSLEPDDRFVVVVVKVMTEQGAASNTPLTLRIIQQMVSNRWSTSQFQTIAEDNLVVIFRTKSDLRMNLEQEIGEVKKRIQTIPRKTKVYFCVSDESTLEHLPELYQEALRISKYCELSSSVIGTDLLTRKNTEPYYLLMEMRGNPIAKEFAESSLRPLRDYDTKYSGSLMETLKGYLMAISIKETAKNMHLHYNTVSYRLEKIKNLLGINLNEGQELFKLRLALYLDEINQIKM